VRKIEARGKTVDDAKTACARELGASPERIRFEVLQEPKGGLFGRPARVRGTLLEGSGDVAKSFVREFFQLVGMDPVVVSRMSEDRLLVSAEGNFDWFTGPKGEALDALQLLVNVICQRAQERGDIEAGSRLTLDLGGFRERRQTELEKRAHEVAEEVLVSRRPVKLEPMSPSDRRIIHMVLSSYPMLATRSEGDEPFRSVVVVPAGAEGGAVPGGADPKT